MRATELQRAACLINYPRARNALPGNGRHHERLEQPVLALGLAAGGSIRDRTHLGWKTAMHSPDEAELHAEAVKVTWYACETCRAMKPRAMTIVRHHHEYSVPLSSDCGHLELEEAIVSSEPEYNGRHHRPFGKSGPL